MAGEGGGLEAALLEMDRALWRLASTWARSLEDREDLRQTMRLKVLERATSFRGHSDPKTWIYKVAYRAGLDWARAQRARPQLRAEGLDENLPAAEGLDREAVLSLLAALERLPRRQRELVVLRELEGLSYKELSEVLGLSMGSVESGLFHARKRLAVLLGDGGRAGK